MGFIADMDFVLIKVAIVLLRLFFREINFMLRIWQMEQEIIFCIHNHGRSCSVAIMIKILLLFWNFLFIIAQDNFIPSRKHIIPD